MKFIKDIKINHLHETIGIDPLNPLFSVKSNIESLKATLIENGIVVETIENFDRSGFRFSYVLKNECEYRLQIEGEKHKEILDFETCASLLDLKIIRSQKEVESPVFFKNFSLNKKVKKARLYITGLGLYEARINKNKVGDRFLTPGFNDYDHYLRVQTYDVSSLLSKDNNLEVFVGNGWYKGRIGLDKLPGKDDKVWGDHSLIALKLVIEYEDLSKEIIYSDETFKVRNGVTLSSSIYDGEVDDYSNHANEIIDVSYENKKYNLVCDFSAPIRKKDELKPTLIITPKGEKVLDFKQNMVGFVRVNIKLNKGQKITLKHGEVLQDECFYNANLRSAKAEVSYIGDGIKDSYEPMFTFFGFRYALVEGIEEVDPSNFEGIVIYSDLDNTLCIETSSKKLNQLMKNAYWGQRGNFLDVPTDCPQRDERMGWTADTQVFVNTACYNMDSYSFYKKYMKDLRVDQTAYYEGDIPMYSPSLKKEAGNGGAVWADAGTIIPWNIYQNYGDKELLKENYPMMKDYCETLISKDKAQGDLGRILYGFTFGDWLAQDGVCAQSMMGGTDNSFIMSVYYYHSIDLLSKAAKVLSLKEDEEKYSSIKNKIKESILSEYFTKTGRFALDTQCSYILALHYELFVNKDVILNQFKERIRKDFYKMKTGFTGTPLLLQTMLDYGLDDDAYRILFNEECPGWLYCVNLGATTIWERWNSILPDGHISGINMNSLNHYAYGSVCEGIYSRIVGLRQTDVAFKKVEIKPHLNYRLKYVNFSFDSPQGEFEIHWKYDETKFSMDIVIPFGVTASIILPSGEEKIVKEGNHHFECSVDRKLNYPFDLSTPNLDICTSKEALDSLRKNCPQAYFMVTGENDEFKISNGYFLGSLPMFGTTKEGMAQYEKDIKNIKM